jgi:uncharacterized protein
MDRCRDLDSRPPHGAVPEVPGAGAGDSLVIPLFSGGTIDLLNPRPEDIKLADIFNGQSRVCRYANQTLRHYSDAEHAILMSWMVAPELAYQALMHDWPESYIGDMHGLFKRLAGLERYRLVEAGLWRAGAHHLQLPEKLHPDIKAADIEVRRWEQASPRLWHNPRPIPTDVRFPMPAIVGFSAGTALASFKERFEEVAPRELALQ